MKPKTLTIKNFGPFYGVHVLDFTALQDFFLVYGNTGAGKTSIFDAISYAFYSKASAGRKDISIELKSHYAQNTEEAFVLFQFEIAKNEYRITRSLPYQRISPRAKKIELVLDEVCLEQCIENEWKDISDKNKSETNKKIQSLIRISYDEFSKIILLPQGEFAQFLKQNSKERKEILGTLFPVSIYNKANELAREKTKKLKVELDQIIQGITHLQDSFSIEEFKTNQENLKKSIISIKEDVQKNRLRTDTALTMLEKSKNEQSRLLEYNRLSEELNLLEQKKDKIHNLKNTLHLHTLLVPLINKGNVLQDHLSKITGLQKNIQNTKKTLIEKKNLKNDLVDKTQKIQNYIQTKESLLLKKEKLSIALRIEKKINEEHQEYLKITNESTILEKELNSIQKQLQDIQTNEKNYSETTAQISDTEEKVNKLRDDLEKRKRINELAISYAQARKSVLIHAQALVNSKKTIKEIDKDIKIAEAELLDLEIKLQKQTQTEQACLLSKSLYPHTPCPVCGSKEHPLPAHEIQLLDEFGSHIHITERIESHKRRIKDLNTQHTQALANHAAIESQLQTAENKVGELFKSFCSTIGEEENCIIPEAIPEPEEANENIKRVTEKLQKETELLQANRLAQRNFNELLKKRASLDASQLEVANTLSIKKIEASKLEAGITSKMEQFLEAFSLDSKNVEDIIKHPESLPDAQEALDECTAKIITLQAKIQEHQDQLSDVEKSVSSLKATINNFETMLIEEQNFLDKNNSLFLTHYLSIQNELVFTKIDPLMLENFELQKQSYLQSKKINTILEFLKRISIPETTQKNIEQEIQTYDRKLIETQTQLKTLDPSKSIENLESPEAISSKIQEYGIIETELTKELEHIQIDLNTLESNYTRWIELEEKRSTLSKKYGTIAELSNDLNGANPQKVPFDAWILGMYLEEITVFANARLERMSKGRYHLKVNDTYRKGNNLGGLELEIHDSYTGKSRPSASLSGGETFMASISLALGLADSIQSRSGGIQLDALFIDEGFGSLDEASIDEAITILDEIRGQRMVAIISHVAELKNRVQSKIEIAKTATGSHIIMHT